MCGGLFSFYPGLPFYSIRRLDMKVVLPVFPNTSLADSIFSYGKKTYPGACNLTQELQGKRFRVSVFARQEQSSQHSLYSFPWQNNNAFLTLLLQPPFQLGHEKLQHNRCKFVLLLIFVTFLFNVGVKNFQVSQAKATWQHHIARHKLSMQSCSCSPTPTFIPSLQGKSRLLGVNIRSKCTV